MSLRIHQFEHVTSNFGVWLNGVCRFYYKDNQAVHKRTKNPATCGGIWFKYVETEINLIRMITPTIWSSNKDLTRRSPWTCDVLPEWQSNEHLFSPLFFCVEDVDEVVHSASPSLWVYTKVFQDMVSLIWKEIGRQYCIDLFLLEKTLSSLL